MRTKSRSNLITVIIAGILLMALGLGFSYSNAEEHQATVVTADYVTEIERDNSNGGMTSTTRYLVSMSDGKIYQIEMTGLEARPGLIGKLPVGQEVKFLTRGYRIEVFGMYPWIDKVL